MTQTLRQALDAAAAALRAAGMDTPELDARLLAQGVLNLRAEDVMLQADDVLGEDAAARVAAAVVRRLENEPVSRILGRRGFWKDVFRVTPDTLDPRPDSETVVEAAIDYADAPLRVLDLGTGTGCLLLSLLREWPEATGIGLDISAGAVRTAEENAGALGLAARASFRAMDWNDYAPDEKYDVIVSNPPYIGLDEKENLSPDVRDYDPPAALFAGGDGLQAYRVLARLVPQWLAPAGHAVFEIGYRQAGAVKDVLAAAGLAVVEVRQDLAGNDRVIVARLTE